MSPLELADARVELAFFAVWGNEFGFDALREVDAHRELVFAGAFPFDFDGAAQSWHNALGEFELHGEGADADLAPARSGGHYAENLLREVIERGAAPGVAATGVVLPS